MIRNSQFIFHSILITLSLSSQFNVSSSTSAITAALKDGTACTMCAACENPCLPIYSPPPPSLPPPSADSNCPPPPSPPSPETYYYSPPPPLPPSVPTFLYYSPPPPPADGGGEFYPPPSGSNFPGPPPPNPIVPYFPFYYQNPPPSASISVSVPLRSVVYSILILIVFFIG